jgi:hypothetical protein
MPTRENTVVEYRPASRALPGKSPQEPSALRRKSPAVRRSRVRNSLRRFAGTMALAVSVAGGTASCGQEPLFGSQHADQAVHEHNTIRTKSETQVLTATESIFQPATDLAKPRRLDGGVRSDAGREPGSDGRRDAARSALLLSITGRDSGTADAAATTSGGNGPLLRLIGMLQWVLIVMMVAVGAAFGMRRWRRGAPAPHAPSTITLVASLPVRNLFQAHLLETGGQRFLITTDRTGVKTVSAVASWDDLEAPVAGVPGASSREGSVT